MPALTGQRAATVQPRKRPTLGSWVTRSTTTSLVLALVLMAACGTSTPSTLPTPTPGDVAWKVHGTGAIAGQTILPVDIAVRGGTVVVAAVSQSSSSGPDAGATLPLWASVDGGMWTAATTTGSTSGSTFSVTAFDGGFVAVGMDGCPASFFTLGLQGCRPAIWRSTDGLAWSRVTLDGVQDAQLTAVTPWKGGLLAVGGRLVTAGTTTARAPLVLRSSNGNAWEKLSPNSSLDSPLTDVAATEDTLIAVGPSSTGSGQFRATAWSSEDGTTWTREPMPTGKSPSQWVAVSTLPGGFGALDVRPSDTAPFTGSVWRRDTTWHAVSSSGEVGGAHLMGIASGPFGGIVLGLDESYRPVVYASQDGAAWGPVSPTGELPADRFAFLAATWADGRFFATGLSLATYSPTILSGMAYVPRPGEIAYVTPVPTPTPTPGPTPAPAPQNAQALGQVSLKAITGFKAAMASPGLCVSGFGGQGLSQITLYDGGTVAGAPLQANLAFRNGADQGSMVEIFLTAFPLDNAGEQNRTWNLLGTVTTTGAGGMTGTVTLANGGGTVTWTCGAWIDAAAQPAFAGNVGQLTLQATAPGWTPSAQPAMCRPEANGQVGGVSGIIGSYQGSSPISLELPLSGQSLAGQRIVADLSNPATPAVRARALVTLTKPAVDDIAGMATFSLRFATPVDGWPQTLAGTLTWRCPGRTDTPQRPMAACTVASDPPTGTNLARGAESTASGETSGGARSQAFDGDLNRAWNAGTYAIQWIEVDLGKAVQVGEVRLVVAQTPAGHTEHHLYGRATPDGPLVELARCGGETNDQQTLRLTVSPSAKPMRYLRIETVASPSWIAWREIEVYAAR